MRSRLALLLAPLLLLSLLPGGVAAAGSGNGASQSRASILAYWTPARMKAAKPRDFTFDAVRGFQPAAKPGGGSGGTVTGASWTGGGAILKASGRVWFTLDGSDWICSGSVVTDGNTGHSIVLTAGHCTVENDGTFATNWVFIPEFDTKPTYTCGSTQWGCWTATALYADKTFANAGSFNDAAVTHDFAFAVVEGGGKTDTVTLKLDDTVGSFGIAYSGVTSGNTLSAFGYPAAGKYHGKDLVYCKGPIGTDPGTDGATWSMPCDMTGGSSGGPWVTSSDPTQYTGTTLRSLNSYGYSGIRNMYGPKFNSDTQAVFNAANSGNLTSTVVRTFIP
jgi:V8-like Glu-specific endopeptidase